MNIYIYQCTLYNTIDSFLNIDILILKQVTPEMFYWSFTSLVRFVFGHPQFLILVKTFRSCDHIDCNADPGIHFSILDNVNPCLSLSLFLLFSRQQNRSSTSSFLITWPKMCNVWLMRNLLMTTDSRWYNAVLRRYPPSVGLIAYTACFLHSYSKFAVNVDNQPDVTKQTSSWESHRINWHR